MAPSDEEEVDNLFGEEEETNDRAVVEQGSDENEDDGGIFGDEDEDEAETEQVEYVALHGRSAAFLLYNVHSI